MGSLSNYAELELLDHLALTAYSSVGTVFVALSTADFTEDGSGAAEPVGNNYAREACSFGTAGIVSRTITSDSLITFNQSSGSWGTISHWAIYDDVSAGNMLAYGAFTTAKNVANGKTPTIAADEIDILFNANGISDYAAEAWLDLMFRDQTFTVGQNWVALCDAAPTDSSTGSTISEPSGNNYGRARVYENGGTTPTWELAASGAMQNNDQIDFATPSGSWGTISHFAVCDASTNGNMLIWAAVDTPETPLNGDPVYFAAGALDVTAN